MRSVLQWLTLIVAIAFSALLIAEYPVIAAEKQTLTGQVSDSMCGAQHMDATPAECTRTCVGRGSKYTLVVGDKLYSLNTSDRAVLAVLDRQAGKSVTVTGVVNGVGIDVSSVVAAK